MALSRLHTLSAVKLDMDVLAGSSVTLGGIRRQTVRTGTDVRQESVSGAVYSQWQSVYAGAPMADFSTVSVIRALTAIGTTGSAIAASSFTGVTLYGNKKLEGGSRAAAGNHISYNIKEGLIIPRRLSVGHQTDAELGVEILATYDGTNAPVVQSNTATLLSTILDDERFSIGPVYLGTTGGDMIQLQGISNIEFDFGINASAEGSDSDVFPTFAVINDIPRPTIRITTSDLTQLAASNGIPLEGKDLDSTNTVIFLRKRKRISTSGYDTDVTASHIKVVPLIGCAYHVDLGDYGSSAGNGSATIEIPLISDGTSAPWAWTLGAAIASP